MKNKKNKILKLFKISQSITDNDEFIQIDRQKFLSIIKGAEKPEAVGVPRVEVGAV